MFQLLQVQKNPYLESLLTQSSVLTSMFFPFEVKLLRNYMPYDTLLALCLLKNEEH